MMYKIGYRGIIEITEEEIIELMRKNVFMEKELKELKRKKESYTYEYQGLMSKACELSEKLEELLKKYKNYKRKSKKKYLKARHDMITEIMYLKNQIEEKHNIKGDTKKKILNIEKFLK